MGEDMGIKTLQEDEGLEPGTILLWLGIGVAIAGFLLLLYQVMTCSCDISVDEEQTSCVCAYTPQLLVMLIGVVIASIGFLVRHRHRRKVAVEKRP